MLIQILAHTPYYVWLILALLVYRGVVAMRDRDVKVSQLFFIPVIMLAMSLQSIAAKFGFALAPVGAWIAGATLTSMLAWHLRAGGATAGAVPGTVRVRGSRVPLFVMMAIFFTKYALEVTLVIEPHYSRHLPFAAAVCALLGVFSGYFLGRLLCDLDSKSARLAGRARPV